MNIAPSAAYTEAGGDFFGTTVFSFAEWQALRESYCNLSGALLSDTVQMSASFRGDLPTAGSLGKPEGEPGGTGTFRGYVWSGYQASCKALAGRGDFFFRVFQAGTGDRKVLSHSG